MTKRMNFIGQLMGLMLILVIASVPVAKSETQNPELSVEENSAEAKQPIWGALALLGQEVAVGDKRTMRWSPGQSFAGIETQTPVLVAHGESAGPILCVVAAVHGDELNGIEMVRRVMEELDPSKIKGAVIGVPIVNLYGFQRGSRYLPDRRDLNRYFPGNPEGSAASRIAHSFFDQIIKRCDMLVDIHTGSFHRSNLTQLRADLNNEAVVNLTKGFGGLSVLKDEGGVGTLRRAATDRGVPTVTLEAGEPMRLQESYVKSGVRGIQSLMSHLGMIDKARFWSAPQPVFYESIWVRANRGGILFSSVSLGKQVKAGQLLGTVTDPVSNVRSEIVAPRSGRVLGMAVNQVVMPGFAAYRIGIRKTEEEVAEEARQKESEEQAVSDSGSVTQPEIKTETLPQKSVDQPPDPEERPE